MIRIDENHYQRKTLSSINTYIWCFIIARGNNGEIDVADFLIEVGDIVDSDISSLSITNIDNTLEPPLTVYADITSDVNITNTSLVSLVVTPQGSSSGSGGMDDFDNDQHYEGDIILGIPGADDEARTVYYKIAAQDETGNIVVTQTYNITLS